ncbi:hypothetical protein NEMIN01_0250 [Nematocida minor]|uniref:uncharacterized protein n=1 Tax=Nematocida minor TaxID=1912983 RepID=UPI00221FEDF0|nr:uncharacterized protein NEMIN01_0250 [Nematocida minor]KAI5188986.1 hypothetical protein NEMIN01_0250 [Nematocida minor]
MKNQKMKKILGASGAVLIFFVAACRGSGNAFKREACSSVDLHARESSEEKEILDLGNSSFFDLQPVSNSRLWNGHAPDNRGNSAAREVQSGQYAAGYSMYENASSMLHNMPGTSRGQDAYMPSIEGLYYSSAIQTPVFVGSLGYNGYSGQSSSTVVKTEYPHAEPNMFALESSILGYSFDPMYGMPSTSRQEDRMSGSDLFPANSYAYNTTQDEYKYFEGHERTGHSRQQPHVVYPSVSVSVFNGAENAVDFQRSRDRMANERGSDLDSIEVDKSSSIYDLSKPIDAFVDMYHLPALSVEEPGASSTVSTPAEPTISNRTARTEKRKAEQMNSEVQASALQMASDAKKKKKENALENMPSRASSDSQEAREKAEKDEKEAFHIYKTIALKNMRKANINKIKTEVWSDRRLTNIRRKGYRSRHKTVYTIGPYAKPYIQNMGHEFHKDKIMRDIENFTRDFASQIKQNALWYFIASTTTNIATKYQTLLQLQDMLEDASAGEHKKMLTDLEGYYPGVIKDILAYSDSHQPMRIKKNSLPTEWKETLGDIYIRQTLKINHHMVEYQSKISQMEKKYSALAYAMRMILTLPEVYQDFSTISAKLIRKTRTSKDVSRNKKNYQILLAVQKLVQMHIAKTEDVADVYEEIYSVLESAFTEEALLKMMVVDLYREIYIVLGNFYENVEVLDTENEYILTGKCTITNHKYMKCEVTADVASRGTDKRVLASNYSLEENRWGISPNICTHYHVYCVDNTTQQLRKICMPMHIDENDEKHCLHTINDMVEHVKKLYGIEEKSDTVYPFKVRKETREWTYIKKGERSLTVKELEEYEVVFYRIEEDLKGAKFTFAEFRSLYSGAEDIIRIPLLLAPLMRSAIELGPFAMMGKHSVVDSIEFEKKVPDVYEYNRKYQNNDYSDVHNYYSNLYIPLHKKKSMECYAMDCKVATEGSSAATAVWYVRMPSSVDEYTCCMLDESFKENRHLKSFNAFIATIESREGNKDNELQGFWMHNNNGKADSESKESAQRVYIWLADDYEHNKFAELYSISEIELKLGNEKHRLGVKESEQQLLLGVNRDSSLKGMKKRNSVSSAKYKTKIKIESLCQAMRIKLSKKPRREADFIVFRNANGSNSSLGAHNEILDFLISCYNHKPIRNNNI